jgi:hypothetical protein
MTQTLDTRRLDPGTADRRTTRIGAALGLLSIVLVATGFAVAAATETTIASPPSEVAAFYTEAGLARTMAGGIVEALGLLLFLPFAAVLTGRVRDGGLSGGLLAPTARMAATVYVTICLAPGMSAGAAALWLAHHGSPDAVVLTALNDLRALSYFIALVAFALFLVTIGMAGHLTGRLPRWAVWSALAIGVAIVASLPWAAANLIDVFGLLGLLWVVAVAVDLLRNPAVPRSVAVE